MTAHVERSWPWRSVAPDGAAMVHAEGVQVRACADVGWEVNVGRFGSVGLATPVSRPERVRVGALRVAREDDAWLETMTVAPDRAAVVGAFARRAQDAGRATWSVTVGGEVGIRFDSTRRTTVVRDGVGLLIAVDHDVALQVHRAPGECRITFTAPAPVHVVIAAYGIGRAADRLVDAVVRDPLLAGRIVDAVVRRRQAAGPSIEVGGAPAIVDAFEWARTRLAWAHDDVSGEAAVWHALGSLVAGDADGARRRLTRLRTDTADALVVLAWARLLAWTGDVAALATVRADLIGRLGRIAAPDLERDGIDAFADADGRVKPAHAACVVAALREGAHLAESLGDAALTAQIASRARRAPGAFARAFRVASERVDDPDGALPAALGVSDYVGESADPSTNAWADLEAGRIRSGTARLAGAAASLLDEVGAGGPGTVPAARCALAILSGLAGWAPDAVRGRVRLRPRVLNDLLPLSVRGLSVAGAAFDLEVARDGPVRRFTIEQTSGAVPLNVVFEAWVPDDAFSSVAVDGRAAQLDAQPLGGGWVLPVQLTPDRARTVAVTTGS